MDERFSRTELLLGTDGATRVCGAHVAVFGIGGVGGHAAEALARSGIGKIDLIDADTVSVSNLNRQIVALESTVGRAKVDVMKERILDINPDCEVRTHKVFFSEENAKDFDFSAYDYVIDAIDTVKSKILLIELATAGKTKIISSTIGNNLIYEKNAYRILPKTKVIIALKNARMIFKTTSFFLFFFSRKKSAPPFFKTI